VDEPLDEPVDEPESPTGVATELVADDDDAAEVPAPT